MTVIVHLSTDTGAPQINGNTANCGIACLYANLVTGFNSGTCTIARVGTTATCTRTAHGFRDQSVVKISGATPSAYNGNWRVTVIDANNFSFEIAGSPTTPPTGTITSVSAPFGWTRPYNTTGIDVYQMPAGTAGAKYRFVNSNLNRRLDFRGYEAMTAHSTGTLPFPTVAQEAGDGCSVHLSDAADTTNRLWAIATDDVTGQVVFVDQYSASFSGQIGMGMVIGGYIPEPGAPVGACDAVCIGQNNTSQSTTWSRAAASPNVSVTANYAARRLSIPGAIQIGKTVDSAVGISTQVAGADASSMDAPNPCNGGVYLADYGLSDGNGGRIGRLGGWYVVANFGLFSPWIIIDGTDDFAGRKLLIVPNGISNGIAAIDMTGPWD